MIQSKEDYEFCLEADRIALNMRRRRPRVIGDDVWKFQRLLRKTEYFHNCKKDILSRIYFMYLYHKWYRLCLKLGFLIPLNVFGPGLCITFWSGPILVNPGATVGENCRISPGVIIGMAPREDLPKLGNHVFIGPHAVIVGPIEIANDVAIGANSFVNKSFTESGITIAGVPAKKILDYGSNKVALRATDMARAQKAFEQWTPEQDQTLTEQFKKGIRGYELANIVLRTPWAMQLRLEELGLLQPHNCKEQ